MTSLDRRTLPLTAPEFGGTANRTLRGSQPDWNLIRHPEPPEGAPNVLLVLIDDAGFGNPSTFGGPIQTPNYTRLGRGRPALQPVPCHRAVFPDPGRVADRTEQPRRRLRFGRRVLQRVPRLHRDAAPGLCPAAADPARQRLQHGGLREVAPDPGRAAGPGRPAGPVAQRVGLRLLLRLPGRRLGPVGPVPGREPEDHRHPRGVLRRGRTRTTCPDAMADKTIEWLHGVRGQDAHKPFFAYFSTGCSHAPHHVASEWADKYKGQFDQGWDRLREEVFERQKELGVVPADAELTASRRRVPGLGRRPRRLQAFYARQMEVYAGFSENADHNVGRVIDAIDELGELDNTLVIWIWGDNGASMEGTITGSFNEMTMQNGIPLTDEMQLQLAERYGGSESWGGPIMDPHYSAAWAWAGNTPFQWGKQVGSHLGGTRNPMVVHWPERIHDPGVCAPSSPTSPTSVPRSSTSPASRPRPRSTGSSRSRCTASRFADSLTDAGRAGAPHPAVLRDHRQPRHVQGRLVAGDEDPPDPVGAHPRGAEALRARTCGTPTPTRPSCTTCPTTSPRPTTSPPTTREKVQELKDLFWAGGGEVQGAAAARHPLGVLRHHPAAGGRREDRVPRRRPERRARHDPAHLQPLLRDQRRPARPRRGRRGRDRGRGRPPRRVLAVRRRRPAHPHLLDDGRVRLPPAGRHSAAGRRGERADGVRRRRGQARHRRTGHAVRQRRTRWVADGWTTRCRCGSPPTQAWTSAATTAAWST